MSGFQIVPDDRPNGAWLAIDADDYVIANGPRDLCEEVVSRRVEARPTIPPPPVPVPPPPVPAPPPLPAPPY